MGDKARVTRICKFARHDGMVAGIGGAHLVWRSGYDGARQLPVPERSTHFICVEKGEYALTGSASALMNFRLKTGMCIRISGYVSLHRQDETDDNECRATVITVVGYPATRAYAPVQLGMFNRDRDGCLCCQNGVTATQVISPPRSGEPGLWDIHFPRGTELPYHKNANLRIGVVISGHGWCQEEVEGRPDDRREVELDEGDAFMIPAEKLHRIVTNCTPMEILTYEPVCLVGPPPGLSREP